MKKILRIMARVGWLLSLIVSIPILLAYAVIIILINFVTVPFKATVITFSFERYSLENNEYEKEKE